MADHLVPLGPPWTGAHRVGVPRGGGALCGLHLVGPLLLESVTSRGSETEVPAGLRHVEEAG